MKWSVVVAGSSPADLDIIVAEAQATSDATPASAEVVADLCQRPTTVGILVVGSDADLARVASAMHSSGRDFPLALIPNTKSDVLAMFGLDRKGAIGRIQSASPYRADLGSVRIGDAVRPFVAHVAANDRRSRRFLLRSDPLVITTARRSYQLAGWWIIAANAQHHAGRTIAPKAALTDGELDIQVFGGSARSRQRLRRLTKRGLHLRDRALWRRSVASCSADIPAEWTVSVDGVATGFGPFEVSTGAQAFDLWV
jgi:hypothetical protein